jgi:hypothetical protein
LGRITAANKPMMTTTTMISMSVKPRARRREREFMEAPWSIGNGVFGRARMIANER